MATTWITWTQAAELTGLPVPTIDYNARIGRIRTRPHHGSRPCVDRDSALAFSEWHQARAARRAALKASKAARAADRRRRRAAASDAARNRGPAPPEPEGWLAAGAAAELLGCTPGHAGVLARKGTLPALRRGGRWCFPEADVRRLAADRGDWVSIVAAGTLVGCAPGTISRALRAGELEQRDVRPGVPSISRRSLTDWATRREAVLAWKAETRRRGERARSTQPPGDVVWLGTRTTALLLGLSEGRVRQLARAERLPHTWQGGRLWFARHHMEQVAAARAFTRLHDRRAAPPPTPNQALPLAG